MKRRREAQMGRVETEGCFLRRGSSLAACAAANCGQWGNWRHALACPPQMWPTSFDELRGGTRGRLKLHNFRSTPPRALPDSKRELQRAVADLYRWGAICRSGIELFLMKATWKPWFVCGNRTRNSVKRYEQLYRGAENPALLA